MTAKANIKGPVTAVLDDAHLGHIQGAFGTILHGDVAPREKRGSIGLRRFWPFSARG